MLDFFSIKIEESIRGRKCKMCGYIVPPGKHLLVINSNSLYCKNICLLCLEDYVTEIKKLDMRNND